MTKKRLSLARKMADPELYCGAKEIQLAVNETISRPKENREARPDKNTRGFTLIEILLALVVSGIALLAVGTFFTAQSKVIITQDQVVDLQQRLRVSVLTMERDIRQIGLNPGALTKDKAQADGVDNNCSGEVDEADDPSTPFVDESEAIGIKAVFPDRMVFTMDADGDGTSCGAGETITYSLNGAALQRNAKQVDADIDVLNLVYLDKTGTPASSIEGVRAVQVVIIARTKREDPAYHNAKSHLNLQGDEILAAQMDGFRRRALMSEIHLRNRH